ncbi:MAG: patatin-like phospholipase family protein [Thiohalocapsa sp.]
MGSLIGDTDIEDLSLPFTAVATDVVSKKEVWLSRGDLLDAIRASIEIPGIFTPKLIDDRSLLDGGLLNPLPVAPSTDDVTDFTIAVNLAGREVSQPYGAKSATLARRFHTSVSLADRDLYRYRARQAGD